MIDGMTSFIIISWNTAELTRRCIQSITEKEPGCKEIIVVDNHSSDATCSMLRAEFPHVVLIENKSNTGYAHANNQGIRIARGDLIILMNSDAALITPDPVTMIRQHFQQHLSCGIIGARQEYANGRLQAMGRDFISVKSLIKSQLLFNRALIKKPLIHPQTTDYVDGAFLAIRRKVISQIGLLNENYFMYAEDMEWCAEAWKHGWQVMVLPQIRVLHDHGASTKKSFNSILVHNAVNQCRFLYKKYGILGAKQGYIVLILGMFLRIPLSILRRNGLAAHYWRGARRCISLWPDFYQLLTGGPLDASGN